MLKPVTRVVRAAFPRLKGHNSRPTVEEAVLQKALKLSKLQGRKFDAVANRIWETVRNGRKSKELSRAELAQLAEISVNFVEGTECQVPSILRMSSWNQYRATYCFVKLMRTLGVDPLRILDP